MHCILYYTINILYYKLNKIIEMELNYVIINIILLKIKLFLS